MMSVEYHKVFRPLYVPNSRRSYCKLHVKFNLNIRYYGYHISEDKMGVACV